MEYMYILDDVRHFGLLNSVSAFPFESYLGSTKRLLRSPNRPLQQLSKRILENKQYLSVPKIKNFMSCLLPVESTLHSNGPDLGFECLQYKEIKGLNFYLRTYSANNCILLANKSIVLANNFIVKR